MNGTTGREASDAVLNVIYAVLLYVVLLLFSLNVGTFGKYGL